MRANIARPEKRLCARRVRRSQVLPPRWAPALLLLLLVGCERDRLSPEEPPPVDAWLEQVETELVAQKSYGNQLAALAAGMDTTAALDSMVVILDRDPQVAWASRIHTGVNVQWASGVRGMLVLHLGGRTNPETVAVPAGGAERVSAVGPGAGSGSVDSEDSGCGIQGSSAWASGGVEAVAYTLPKNRRSLYLAPDYNYFRVWDDAVIAVADSVLPAAGYDRLVVRKEGEVTLEELRKVATGGYGVVRMSGHGAPWPSEQNIQEVYFLTGEASTPERDIVNKAALESGNVGVNTYLGQNLYSISADYFTANNRFGGDAPLMILGFCFGYLGGWPEDLRSIAGAGAVVGWDWEVISMRDAGRSELLLSALCDTAQAAPVTVQAWYPTIEPGYDYGDRVVSIHFAAADSFALWAPEGIDLAGIEPAVGQPGEEVSLYGSGFGTTAGTVLFGDVPATGITLWRDGAIHCSVPNLPPGQVQVTVRAGRRRSAPVSFFVQDDLLERLNRTWYINFFLRANHNFQPWDAGSETHFSHLIQPLVWDGMDFSGERREVTGDYRRLHTVTGSVAPDGRTLSLEYVVADTFYTGLGTNIEYKRAKIAGLPFDDIYAGSPHYSIGGSAVPSKVLALEWRRTVDDGGGNVEVREYLSTDWDFVPERFLLGCEFH